MKYMNNEKNILFDALLASLLKEDAIKKEAKLNNWDNERVKTIISHVVSEHVASSKNLFADYEDIVIDAMKEIRCYLETSYALEFDHDGEYRNTSCQVIIENLGHDLENITDLAQDTYYGRTPIEAIDAGFSQILNIESLLKSILSKINDLKLTKSVVCESSTILSHEELNDEYIKTLRQQ